MKNYFVKKIDEKDFRVIEKMSNYVIKCFGSHKNAQMFSARLNGGQGFNGETPTFFIRAKDQE